MSRRVFTPVSPLVAAALIGMTGCTYYTLKPDAPLSMPRAGAPPLPLRVGVAIENQAASRIEGQAPTGGIAREMSAAGNGIGPQFVRALRQANLFRSVQFPLPLNPEALENVDLVISGQFSYKFVQDPLQGPKIVFVCFTGLITGAVLRETSHHIAQGALAIRDMAGQEIKSYDETMDVAARSMVSLFAEISTGKKGPPAAIDNLVAKLVQNLIDDRPLFERMRARRPSSPKRRRGEPADEGQPAKVSGEWWKQDASEDEPASRPVEPSPERREPGPDEAASPQPKPASRDADDLLP